MASQGPNFPSVGADDSAVGSKAWSNPTNIYTDDGTKIAYVYGTKYTTVYSHYLKATGFGFTIPAGATIDGILVQYKRFRTGSGTVASDEAVRLVVGGSITGNSIPDTDTWGIQTWEWHNSGGATEKWGLTPTAAQVNATDFGVVLEVKMENGNSTAGCVIDAVKITVYYTEAAAEEDELASKDISSGVPTVDKSTIGQTHVLTSTSVTTPAPTVDKSTIAQIHALVGRDVSTPVPTVDKSTIAQVHALVAKDIITPVPTVDKATLGQIHALVSKDVSAGTPTVDKSTLGQKHALTPKDVTSGVPAVDKPTITQVHGLTSKDIATPAPTVDKATLAQIHALVSKDVATPAPIVSKPVIGQIHALVAVDITAGAPIVDKPTIGGIEVSTDSAAAALFSRRVRKNDDDEALVIYALLEREW